MPNFWADPRPFALGPPDATTAFVLVHGFTGAPAEMRPLGELLAALGYRAIGVQLPGHGSSYDNLEGVVAEAWLETVLDGLRWARERASRVVLVGLSMGGLLAAVVAGEHLATPDGVVLLAPAVHIRDPLFSLVGLGRFVLRSVPAPAVPRGGLTSLEGWKRLWHYDRRPLDAIWQLRRLQQRALRAIGGIDQPTLVVQGEKDLTLVPGAATILAERIGENATMLWLPQSGHCLTADVELETVVGAIEALLGRMEAQGLFESGATRRRVEA